MRAGISFSLSAAPKEAEEILARLEEALEVLNDDKEEQAIEGDFFTGNLKDYPDWLREAFGRPELVAALERFCEFEPGELEDWDLESWYDDMFSCLAWDYKLRKRKDGRRELLFQVEEEHYGGDMSHAWILLAAGAADIRALGVMKD
jgi:hypothetical protein